MIFFNYVLILYLKIQIKYKFCEIFNFTAWATCFDDNSSSPTYTIPHFSKQGELYNIFLFRLREVVQFFIIQSVGILYSLLIQIKGCCTISFLTQSEELHNFSCWVGQQILLIQKKWNCTISVDIKMVNLGYEKM